MRLMMAWLAMCLVGVCASSATIQFQTGAVFGAGHRLEEPVKVQPMALDIEGDRLYLGGRGVLAVYDISRDPLHPKLLGKTDEIASVRQIAVQNKLVYAVTRADGLWIVDCREPQAPKTIGHLPSTSNCTGVDVAGPVCFIGGSRSGIDFVDVSDPVHPQLIANHRQEPVESQSVAYRDGYLYSGEWNAKCVTVWNCRDMKAIERVALTKLASNGDGVWLQGQWLYANTGWSPSDSGKTQPRAGQMGLEIFDMSNPRAPKKTARIDFEYCQPLGLDTWTARASGNVVFCAQNMSGLYAVDVADKTHPRILDRWGWLKATGAKRDEALAVGHASEYVASVVPGDGVVYVAGPALGAWVIPARGARKLLFRRGKPPVHPDVRPPRPPVPEGFVRWLPKDESLVATVTGTAVRGDLCYVACGTAGLYVLNLSEDGLREVYRLPLPECMDVSVAGDRLFVAAGREGFIGYDIAADGTLKEFLRQASRGARDVYAYGDGRRWVSFNTTVHDISDPKAPKPLVNLVQQARWNKFMGPDLLDGRWVMGNSALKYMTWVDLAAPQPDIRKIQDYKARTGCICALGKQALLVDGGKWALLEPGAQHVPAFMPFPKGGVASGIPRSDGNLVAVCAGKRVGVWDFSEPAAPRPLSTFAVPGGMEPVAFWNHRLVVPALTTGVLLSSPVDGK